jgi:FlaA1/EpsC-like NDP-sugar epimerase
MSAGEAPRASPYNTLSRHLPWVHFVVDSLVWALAIPLTTLLRYDFDAAPVWWQGVFFSIVVAVTGQGTFGYFSGLYRRQWRYGSFDEVLVLALTNTLAGMLLTLTVLFQDTRALPYSVSPLATAFTITGSVAARSLWRLFRARRTRPSEANPIVVVGAGNGAYQIVRTLLNSPESPFNPVALLDDDPLKSNLRLEGVRVEGPIDNLGKVAQASQATAVLMAIPTADGQLVRRVNELADRAKLPLYVLPKVTQLFGAPALSDIRRVSEADLLGRAQTEIDHDAIAQLIHGRRVLVTGAGGSIGSELCRQLARFEPECLVMLDRDESGLHATQLSIEGRAMLDSPNLALADIRDVDRLRDLFLQHRPHVVYHAAALKHLTLLEQAPAEAWKTNVVGTQNVLDAAVASGTERLVNISTDKAADPSSVLGYSKRITERLTAAAAENADGEYVSVRFGNVLGSRGSVLTAFRMQAESGGPITVTHPDVTRFFMTVEEAVRLTLYASAIGRSGEALVLDMGDPVRIQDVAERFAHQHTPPLEIVYTGLRPGEKLHEDLVSNAEAATCPVHPMIAHVSVPVLGFDQVCEAVGDARCVTADLLRDLASHLGRQRNVAIAKSQPARQE